MIKYFIEEQKAVETANYNCVKYWVENGVTFDEILESKVVAEFETKEAAISALCEYTSEVCLTMTMTEYCEARFTSYTVTSIEYDEDGDECGWDEIATAKYTIDGNVLKESIDENCDPDKLADIWIGKK